RNQGSKFLQENPKKPRKKACISLFSLGRIGTFQWVTANPSKKIWPCVNSRLGLRAKRLTSQPSIISGHQRIISKLLIFAKKNQSDPRRRANVVVSGSHRLELAASRWRF